MTSENPSKVYLPASRSLATDWGVDMITSEDAIISVLLDGVMLPVIMPTSASRRNCSNVDWC